jgi:hypothetical protein
VFSVFFSVFSVFSSPKCFSVFFLAFESF